MQVLCKPSDSSADIHCPVCGKGFRLYWERSSVTMQEATLPSVREALRGHHDSAASIPHQDAAFNIPSWSGPPQFSAAALLGGATL